MDDSLLVDVEQVSDSNTDISAVAHASTDSSEESPRAPWHGPVGKNLPGLKERLIYPGQREGEEI